MFDPVLLTLVTLTSLLAGGVKGVIGLGLPTVSLALLTVTVGLQPAMALLLVPSFVTVRYTPLLRMKGQGCHEG